MSRTMNAIPPIPLSACPNAVPAAKPALLSVEGLHSGYGRIPILGGVSLTVG
jgi:hypothetical protein